jgi:hypothetical protein
VPTVIIIVVALFFAKENEEMNISFLKTKDAPEAKPISHPMLSWKEYMEGKQNIL